MQNCDPLDGIFYPTLTLMIDSYNLKLSADLFFLQLQACRSIFQHASTSKSGRDFLISVSYLEIRDESMTDLLNPHNNSMIIKEHPTKGM